MHPSSRALAASLSLIALCHCAGPGDGVEDPTSEAQGIDLATGVGAVARVATGFHYVEGPAWFAERDTLLFSDENADLIEAYTPPDAPTVFRAPSNKSNGNAVDPDGLLVTCESGARRITRTLADGTVAVVADHYEGLRFNSPNDVVVGADGTVYFTDPVTSHPVDLQLGYQGVFRVTPAGTVALVTATMHHPNGIALAPDGSALYVSDTVDSIVVRFPVQADGSTGAGTHFASLGGGGDGMAVDDAGQLYVAAQAGIRVFGPRGALRGTITLPEQPSNCAFGGADRRTLFITARTSLYRARTATPGLP